MSEDKTAHPDETAFGKIHKRRQSERKVRCFEVSAWGTDGKPLKLYAYPITTGEVMALDGRYPTQTETNVMQIIRQCRDSNGDAYFSLLDKTALMNEPSQVIGDVLVHLNADISSFDEELKKNNE